MTTAEHGWVKWLVSNGAARTNCVFDHVAYTTVVGVVSFNIAAADNCETC